MVTCLINVLLNLSCDFAVQVDHELADRSAIEPRRIALAASDILYGHREVVEIRAERFSEEEEDIEEPSLIRAFSAWSSS